MAVAVKRRAWIQPSEAARLLDVTAFKVHQWISDGTLRATKLPTGHLRILSRDVVRFLFEQGRPVPEELGDLGNKHVLIIDADRGVARSMAAVLRGSGGCEVTVAETAAEARGLLNGMRPDLVLLGAGWRPSVPPHADAWGMLILAEDTGEARAENCSPHEVAFRVNDILLTPVDERTLLSSVARLLLG